MRRINAIFALAVLLAAAPATQSDLSTPENAVRAYYHALFDGDWPALDAVTINDDASAAYLKSLQHSIATNKLFAAAVRGKFGEDATKRFGFDAREKILTGLPNAKATIDGDKAAVDTPLSEHSKQRVPAVKMDGVWKYDARQKDAKFLKQMTQMSSDRADKTAALTDRVDAGEFAAIDDLWSVYQSDVMPHLSSTSKPSEKK